MRRKNKSRPTILDSEVFDPVTIGRLVFPDPRGVDEYGLVAVGGDFSPELLLAAYANGIFPWPSEDFPYSWFSPDPRMLLRPMEFHCSRSLRKTLRRRRWTVSFDTVFEEVLDACAEAPRSGDPGTWIVEELRQGFLELHAQGFAHSVEVWQRDELVGGLYGLSLGGMFCGESMFHRQNDASKVALWALCRRLADWGFEFIDCQVHTAHLESLGAREWSRDEFLSRLCEALKAPTHRGLWNQSDDDSDELIVVGVPEPTVQPEDDRP